jgi:CRISPR system Cascade subunit CasD
MRVLILRFDAPLVSFGAPVVDQRGVVQDFPTLSMLTGLIANASGWDHRDTDKLTSLQEGLRFAARIDRRGEPLVDYQIVDLGQAWMRPKEAGWTTRGRITSRGGASAEGLHIRYRHYRADSIHTVALTLVTTDAPSVDEVARALRAPARPLFLGRKCCLPASPILLDVLEAPSLVAALAAVSRVARARADNGPLPACWWDGDDVSGAVGESWVVPVTDERDWRNQIHVGRRIARRGHVDPPEASRD